MRVVDFAPVGGSGGVKTSREELLYLRGDKRVIAERIAQRKGHFMPPSLLESQFATLEEPGPDEHPLIVEVHGAIDETVNDAIRLLEQGSPTIETH